MTEDERKEALLAQTPLPTRPMRRLYILTPDGLVDARLLPPDHAERSTAIDPLIRGRLYKNLTSHPIWVDSRSQLKALLKKYHRIPVG